MFDLDDVLLKASVSKIDLTQVDEVVEVTKNGTVITLYVQLRPFALTMLQRLKPHFELIIFNNAPADYTNKLVSLLEKEEKFFSHVLSGDDCKTNQYLVAEVKDLTILMAGATPRTNKDILMIDNQTLCYML